MPMIVTVAIISAMSRWKDCTDLTGGCPGGVPTLKNQWNRVETKDCC